MVLYCQKISKRPWISSTTYNFPSLLKTNLYKGQTILHLAARLGYTRLIVCLLRWRDNDASPALEFEVDALRKDAHGRTPLSWACIAGHGDAALILYRWNPQALKAKDNHGIDPLKYALQKGMDKKPKIRLIENN